MVSRQSRIVLQDQLDCYLFHVFSFFPKVFKIFGGQMSLFGATDTLFWTYGDISSVFQSQSGQPYLHFTEANIMYIP